MITRKVYILKEKNNQSSNKTVSFINHYTCVWIKRPLSAPNCRKYIYGEYL